MRAVLSVVPALVLACTPAPEEIDCVDVPLEACDVTPGCRVVAAHRARIDEASGFSCWEDGVIPVACQPAFDAERCPTDRTPATGPSTDQCLLFDDVCTPEDWGDCAPPAEAFCPVCETLDRGPFVSPEDRVTGMPGLGRHLAAGDLNDDGVPDLVASGDDGVRVVFGPLSEASAVLTLSSGDRPTDEEVFLAVGDLDGDGVNDLVVGTPSAQRVASTARHGQVAWHRGPLAAGSRALLADADLQLEGRESGFELGAGFAIADVTGDGQADLLVVSRGDDSFSRDGGAILRVPGPLAPAAPELVQVYADSRIAGPDAFGRAFLVRPSVGEAPGSLIVEQPGGIVVEVAFDEEDREATIDDGTVLARVRDLPGGGRVTRMASGDVDGDGQEDLVLGLPGEPGTYDEAGRVVVVTPDGEAEAVPDAGFAGRGRCEGDRLGLAVAVADLDGDDVDEVIVGAGGGSNVGGLVLRDLSLGAGDTDAGTARVTDVAPRLGVAAWGEDILVLDVDDDGRPEIVAGLPTVGAVVWFDPEDLPAP